MTLENPKCAECLVGIGYPHDPRCELKGIVTKQECNTHLRDPPMLANKKLEMYCEECKATEGQNHHPKCSWAGDGLRIGEKRQPVFEAHKVYCMECQSTVRGKHDTGCSQADPMLEVGGPVVHPKHYNQHPAGIEAIDVIEHMQWNIGTAIKHLWRTGLKKESYAGASEQESAVRDLHSAIWYIQREIERIEQPFTMRKGPKAK